MVLHEAMHDERNFGEEGFLPETLALMPWYGGAAAPEAEEVPLPFLIFSDEDDEDDVDEEDSFEDMEEEEFDDDEYEDDFDDDEDEDDFDDDEEDDYDYDEDGDFDDFDE